QARAAPATSWIHGPRTRVPNLPPYLEPLVEAASGVQEPPARASAHAWRLAAVAQGTRLDRLVDSILAAVRGDGLTRLAREPFDVGEVVSGSIETLALLLRPHKLRWSAPSEPLVGLGDEARFRQ